MKAAKGLKPEMEDVQPLKSFFSLVFFSRNKAAELGAWFEREVEGPLAGKEDRGK